MQVQVRLKSLRNANVDSRQGRARLAVTVCMVVYVIILPPITMKGVQSNHACKEWHHRHVALGSLAKKSGLFI